LSNEIKFNDIGLIYLTIRSIRYGFNGECLQKFLGEPE